MADRPAPHELHVSARRFYRLPWPRKRFGMGKHCTCAEAETMAQELRARRARVEILCRRGHDTPPPARSRWRMRRGIVVATMSRSEAKRLAYPARGRAATRSHGRARR